METAGDGAAAKVGATMTDTDTLALEVRALIAQIANRFQPARIVLFGSHAAGVADSGSDVDLLVVMDTQDRPLRQAAAIYRAIDHRLPVDILVRRPRQIAEPDPRDLILRTVLREGVTLYDEAVRCDTGCQDQPEEG